MWTAEHWTEEHGWDPIDLFHRNSDFIYDLQTLQANSHEHAAATSEEHPVGAPSGADEEMASGEGE